MSLMDISVFSSLVLYILSQVIFQVLKMHFCKRCIETRSWTILCEPFSILFHGDTSPREVLNE